MSTPKRRILIQLDSDAHASVFDRVVAMDAGVEELFSCSGVKVEDVQALVHGAMFTRGGDDLKSTAIFVGGSDVTLGEQLFQRVKETFFGPLRVSVMFDANGANTTAAAAVLSAGRHLPLNRCHALVLGGTGPVGRRAARLLARQGATVALASRELERAAAAAGSINQIAPNNPVKPVAVTDDTSLAKALGGVTLVIAAGAAGASLLPAKARQAAHELKVAIDLNAVPPSGIEGMDVMDKGRERDGIIVYGAVGVGGLKMKIHKAAIASLFTSQDRLLDAQAIYELGQSLM